MNVTVGQMDFFHDTANREYNIVGANTITFDASAGNATLTVNMQDKSRIAAAVVLTTTSISQTPTTRISASRATFQALEV